MPHAVHAPFRAIHHLLKHLDHVVAETFDVLMHTIQPADLLTAIKAVSDAAILYGTGTTPDTAMRNDLRRQYVVALLRRALPALSEGEANLLVELALLHFKRRTDTAVAALNHPPHIAP